MAELAIDHVLAWVWGIYIYILYTHTLSLNLLKSENQKQVR